MPRCPQRCGYTGASTYCKMKNKEKKDHHFVPQVYLGKFAHSSRMIGKKTHYFVSTFDKINSRENNNEDVKNICFKTKLYTVDSPERERRESIENFYANSVESDYSNVFKILTNERKVTVTKNERELIILTIINLHLRNLVWLKTINDFWTGIIENHNVSNPVNIYNENGDILFPFETQSVEKIISEHKIQNRQAFINEHLRLTINLTKSHFNDIIFVDRNPSMAGFITSDRPVICTNISESFRLPISKDYYLTIMPNKENVEYDTANIVRNNPFIDARTLNIMQYENAERLIIGNNLDDIRLAKEDYQKAVKC